MRKERHSLVALDSIGVQGKNILSKSNKGFIQIQMWFKLSVARKQNKTHV